MGEAAVLTGQTPPLPTAVDSSNQGVLMVLMELRVKEGSLGMHKGVPPLGSMGVTVHSLMEDNMDTRLLQVRL